MVGIEFVILGVLLVFALARAIKSTEHQPVVVEVPDDAHCKAEDLRYPRAVRGRK